MFKIASGKALFLATAFAATASTVTTFAATADTSVDMIDLESGKSAGTVTISESEYGLVFSPSLDGIEPGGHGFHVHENPSCDKKTKDGKVVLGGAAGSHYDPENTNNHGYPWSEDAHKGDLPLLFVGQDNKATHPVLAPRLEMEDVKERALMIHAGGDNYSDEPEKLGGGGARVVCGVIK